MKKWLCMVVCCLSVYVQAQVWTMKGKEPTAPGTWWCFRNTVTLTKRLVRWNYVWLPIRNTGSG